VSVIHSEVQMIYFRYRNA